MKAIVVRQPWATLIALGIKTIETRPAPPNGPMRPQGVRGLPGLPLERGERIAIVAAAWNLPESWHLRRFGEWTLFTRHYTDGLPQIRRLGCITPDGSGLVDDAYERQLVVDLPLGAVVCTVRVDDALPIVDGGEEGAIRTIDNDWGQRLWIVEPETEDYETDWQQHIGNARPGPPEIIPGDQREITDQLPLGDFTPGRWGWLLSDPQPPRQWSCEARRAGHPKLTCTERAPHGDQCAWVQGPVPCKGRQGVFRLPGDVTEALGQEVGA